MKLTEALERKIHDLDSLQTSQAFCMKPWVHLFISHFGTVVPCCLTPWEKEQALGDINEQSVEEIWNGEKMRELRLGMLKDEKDKRCWQCYENEKIGLRSTRNFTNLLYADKLDWVLNTDADGTASKAKPIYWDIRVSNLCNFKCRICGHHSSSQWYEDARKLGLLSHNDKVHHGPKDFDRLMRQLEFVIPDLEEIYFAGGEPLIMEEHYYILNMLIEKNKTNIRLRYSTNFSQTTYKETDLFKLWAQFEDIYVHASLDGSDERGELQRHGQSWEQVVANRQRMMEVCPNVNFTIASTISVFNILHLPDFHRDWTEKGFIGIDEFIPHILRSPAEYSICILPPGLKRVAEEKLNRHIKWITDYAQQHPPKPISKKQIEIIKNRLSWLKAAPVTEHYKLNMVINEFKNCIAFMNSRDDSNLIPEFSKKCRELDILRGENTALVFPELAELLK
jgi:radical SAM protein with 4Fe4S-binding SPASM domain